MAVSIEQHVDFVTDAVAHLRNEGYAAINPTVEAEDEWLAHVEEVGNFTLYPIADSWYVGANVPGKPRVFMAYIGGVGSYRERCDRIAANGYEGFQLIPA
jgi:cyclohexanone monooxygenase